MEKIVSFSLEIEYYHQRLKKDTYTQFPRELKAAMGGLLFISDTAYLVITDDLSTHDVEMQVVPVN